MWKWLLSLFRPKLGTSADIRLTSHPVDGFGVRGENPPGWDGDLRKLVMPQGGTGGVAPQKFKAFAEMTRQLSEFFDQHKRGCNP